MSNIKQKMTYCGHHTPSGEDWVILGVDQLRKKVCVAGWPATVAEFENIKNLTERSLRTVEEEVYVTKQFGVSFLN